MTCLPELPKPPIGISPNYIWAGQRMCELADTIKRYADWHRNGAIGYEGQTTTRLAMIDFAKQMAALEPLITPKHRDTP